MSKFPVTFHCVVNNHKNINTWLTWLVHHDQLHDVLHPHDGLLLHLCHSSLLQIFYFYVYHHQLVCDVAVDDDVDGDLLESFVV